MLIDTRTQEEYEHGFIPGCVLFTPDQVRHFADAALTPLPKDKKIILYCKYGTITRDLAEYLIEKGYDACSLSGGYGAWALDAIKNEAQGDKKRQEIENGIQKKFHAALLNPFARAVLKYQMIADGDKIAVCIRFHADGKALSGVSGARAEKIRSRFSMHGPGI